MKEFFFKTYDAENYHCAHFVCDVWEKETGHSIRNEMFGFLFPPKDQVVDMSLRSKFKKLSAPKSPCLVLMHGKGIDPHVGIFLRGRVFHMSKKHVEWMPLQIATLGFTKVGFYDVENS